MWNLGKRDVIALVSVISGCALLGKLFGLIYAITVIFVLITSAFCIIVVANDNSFTPCLSIVIDCIRSIARETNEYVENSWIWISEIFTKSLRTVERRCRSYAVEIMAQRRRSTYQLSAENYPTSMNPRLGLVAGISPILRRTVGSSASVSNAENDIYGDGDSRILERSSSMSKITSTPMVPWKKEEVRNGDIFGSEHVGAGRSPWAKADDGTQNHTLSRGEDVTYSTKGSPWGNSISPKMRARAGGVKTVQTVAGPLLASTRYNIDSKVYSDVTSPGFASRLTKYAAEANAKLTHLSQYGTGQFPRVNLNAGPTPMINSKTGKVRMPVTVRVAPPENTQYSPPERRKILSDICHAETKTAPSVVQVLKEISLKRHASREDVTFELAKKQRTDGVFADGLENLEEMTQKRTRDDSSRSEEDISPQNKTVRPAKRTKMPSCHDILSSLSSSIIVSSGIKRKAIDTSRSGTPDVGKHFKSLDPGHGDTFVPTIPSRVMSEQARPIQRPLNDFSRRLSRSTEKNHFISGVGSPEKKCFRYDDLTAENENDDDRDVSIRAIDERDVRGVREKPTVQPQTVVKLTDRLFMKAEPQNIDKLKTLIEEHGTIKPRFLTNESDEIKKSDIVNMRQTSMKSRLKSMFDAISGKAPSAINPEVVIQAEEAKSSTASTTTASLSSSTSTTNVNTSPIAISAIVPIIGKTKPNATPAKHVRFQFGAAESIVKTTSDESPTLSAVETKLTNDVSESKESSNIANLTGKSDATKSIFQSFNSPIATTAASASTFSFGASPLNAISSATTNLKPTSAAASINSIGVTSTTATTVAASPPKFNSTQIFDLSTIPTSVSDNFMSTVPKSNASVQPNSTQASNKISQSPAISFSFGNPATSANAPAAVQSPLFASTPSQSFAAPTTTSSASSAPGIFGITNKTTAPAPFGGRTPTNSFAVTATPATTSAFSFGVNATPQTTEKKTFAFGTAAANVAPNPSNAGSTQTSQAATTPIVAPTTATTGFSFSASNVATANNNRFGSATTTSSTSTSAFPPATASNALFSFGTNTAATSKPTFAFASSTTNTTAAVPATAADSVSFGTTNNNSAIPLFGAAPTATTTAPAQPTVFGTPATSAPGFSTTGNNNTTFGTTTGQSTFGVAKTMDPPSFGTTTTAPPSFAASSTASGLFSGAVNSNATPTTVPTSAAPAFGTPRFGEAKPPPPAFGAPTTPNFPATSGTSLFGSQPTGNPTFGTPTSSTTTGATSLFGTPNTSVQTFGTPVQTFGNSNAPPPPAFGATNPTTATFGTPTTSASGFGSNGGSAPSFGVQSANVAVAGNQSSTGSAFNATSPTFGAVTTAPPAFGTSIASPSAFGTAATSGFGTPGNPPPAFSANANTSFSGFGGGSNAASPFGSQPATGTMSFGTPSSSAPTFGAGGGNGGSFAFGAGQTSAQQPQQSASFAFGSGSAAPNANAAGGSAPFQFGNAAAPQSGGFNFSGAPSAPALNFSRDGNSVAAFPAPGTTAFNAPTTGGMFSIGSGSTGPRSRPSRRRQR